MRTYPSTFLGSLLTAAALALGLVAPSALAAEEKIEVKVGMLLPEESIFGVSAKMWGRLVDVRTGGRVQIKLYPAGQLGKERAQFEGLLTGTHEVFIHTSLYTGKFPELRFWDLPFAFPSSDDVARLIYSPIADDITAAFSCQNMAFLSQGGFGYNSFTMRNGPINTPNDFKGVKHRVPPSRSRIILFEALGASPSTVAYGELYQALLTGVADGQDNPLSLIYAAKFHEATSYLSILNYIYNPYIMAAGKPFWDKLDKPTQDVLLTTAREVQGWSIKQADLDDAIYLAKIREERPQLKVNTLDPKTLPQWQERSKVVYDAFREEAGPAWADAVSELLKGGHWKSPGRTGLRSCN